MLVLRSLHLNVNRLGASGLKLCLRLGYVNPGSYATVIPVLSEIQCFLERLHG